MARSAVLAGRVLADALCNLFAVVLMLGVGYLVGFRLHTSVPALVAAAGVLLLFGFAISWVTVLLGLAAGSTEASTASRSAPTVTPTRTSGRPTTRGPGQHWPGPPGPRFAWGHIMWRWRESNPRPSVLHQGFSGRSLR